MLVVFAVLSLMSLAAWLVLWLGHGRFWHIAPRLPAAGRHAGPGLWPAVDVVIPARDEADILPETLTTLLSQDYPGRLRVLLVDDHSTDGTGTVANNLAANISAVNKLTVVRSANRPAGWTGKLWALQQGVAASAENGAPLLLFTDADIAHPPDSVRRLAAQALAGDYDLVSLMAWLRYEGFWARLLVPAFVYFFAMLYPFRRVADSGRRTAGAAGGCVLVRRSALQRAGGLEQIAGALIDDCSLGRLIKHHGRLGGGRIWLGFTREVVSRRPCQGLGAVWRMVVRTAFVQLRHSWVLLGGTVFGMALLFMGPPLALACGIWLSLAGHGTACLWLSLAGAATWGIMTRTFMPMVRWYRLPWALSALLPLAGLVYTLMTVDSARRFVYGRGGAWKGRTY